MTDPESHRPEPRTPQRRGFLRIAVGAMALTGAGAAAWPFIASLWPDADSAADGDVRDVDIASLSAGQSLRFAWQGRPIVVIRRGEVDQLALRDPILLARMSDPDSANRQQPDYAQNWHRSIRADIGVYVAACTRLLCVLDDALLCPCCNATYDTAGRIVLGPAPYNLAVPPHRFVGADTLRIGRNPPGTLPYDLGMVERV